MEPRFWTGQHAILIHLVLIWSTDFNPMQFALGYKSIWTVNHRNQFNWDSVAFRMLLQTWFKRPKYGWKKCSVIIVPKTNNLSSEWIRCATFSFFVTKLPWNEIISLWSYFRLDACMEKKPFDCIPDENIWQSGNIMCEHSNTRSQCLNSNAHHVNPIFAWTQISSRCCVQICVRDSVQTPLWIL